MDSNRRIYLGCKGDKEMTSDGLKKSVSAVFEKPYQIHLYFILKEADEYSLCLADIEDEKTSPEIKKLFSSNVVELIVSSEVKVRNLPTADEAPNAIYLYDYEEYPDALGILKDFDIREAIKLPKFNFETDSLSNLFGYIIYLGSMENGMVLFKKHYPISLIKRDSFLLWKRKERFELLSGIDIIRLNGDFQILRVADQIFVLDIRLLEQSMGFSALIQKAADETVSAIESLGILDDIQVLKDTLETPSFARKLSKIKKASPIFTLGISKERIIEFTKETPELAGKFKYSEDGSQIRLDTKKSKDAFINLMNDDFLRSELTKQYYEALAKDSLK